MSLSYKTIVESKPTEFVVGEERKHFWIHRSIIGQQSGVLEELIDSQPWAITLPQVSKGTFARFAEYLYTGSYTAGGFSLVEDTETDVISECGPQTPADSSVAVDSTPTPELAEDYPTIESAACSWDEPVPEPEVAPLEEVVPREIHVLPSRTKKGKKKGLSKRVCYEPEYTEATLVPPSLSPPQPEPTQPRHDKDTLWAAFKSRAYVDQETRRSTPTLRPNETCSEIYRTVFISHAEIFAFASTYNIQNLRQLAIRNLHETLVSFTLYPDRVSDISALLEFAYKSGEIEDATLEPLRDMVADYAVCHYEDMVKDPLFGRLLAGGGAMTVDLMTKVMQRLH